MTDETKDEPLKPTAPVDSNASPKDAKKAAREAIKARYAQRAARARNKPRTGKLIDYDLLPPEHQAKYFGEDGRLIFLELTGESKYPQWVIDTAFDLYSEGLTLEAIAIKWDVDQQVVNKWARSQSWQKKLDKIRQAVEDQVTKAKVKKVVSRRQELDEQHTVLMQRIKGEVWFELDKRPREGEDPKLFELRQNTRMKTLKIAYEVFAGLISTERMIAGISVEQETDGNRVPSSFEFVIKTEKGDGNEMSIDELKAALPSQDPHTYTPGPTVTVVPTEVGDNAPLALSEPQEGMYLPEQGKDTLPEVVVAPGGVVGRQAGSVAPKVDPVRINQFGSIDTGPSENPAWQRAQQHPLGWFGEYVGGGY